MGEVYKARDTRLDRTVAIKILPSIIASDPAYRVRFEREAKALAALSHPHICPLFDVGHQNGTDFLVMEFLEGETLAARLRRGRLSIDRAIRCAIEIADALDKAHRHGIVHRDLKAGNVMLTKAGVKLLDFGLAKLHKPIAIAEGDATTPAPEPATMEGTILGTLHYMAPEQLEGRTADARTDIWAFGCMLHEMLTGARPFDGNSSANVMASILTVHVASVSSLQPAAPPALDHVVKRWLNKDPEDRWQTARDVRAQLEWLATPVTESAQRLRMRAWAVRSRTALRFYGVFSEPPFGRGDRAVEGAGEDGTDVTRRARLVGWPGLSVELLRNHPDSPILRRAHQTVRRRFGCCSWDTANPVTNTPTTE